MPETEFGSLGEPLEATQRRVRLAARALARAYDSGGLSARGRDRALRVARTIADLGGGGEIGIDALAQALGYRHESERLGSR